MIFDQEKDRAQVTLWDAATGWVPRTFDGPRGTGRDVNKVHGPLPGRTGLRHEEPIRSRGPGRPLHQSLGCGDGRTVAAEPEYPEEYSGDDPGMASRTTARCWSRVHEPNDQALGPGDRAGPHDRGSQRTNDDIRGVAISNNGRRIASARTDKNVRLWDVEPATCPHLPTFRGGHRHTVAFSPDGRYLAAGGWDGAGLWDLTTRKPARLRGQPDAVAQRGLLARRLRPGDVEHGHDQAVEGPRPERRGDAEGSLEHGVRQSRPGGRADAGVGGSGRDGQALGHRHAGREPRSSRRTRPRTEGLASRTTAGPWHRCGRHRHVVGRGRRKGTPRLRC